MVKKKAAEKTGSGEERKIETTDNKDNNVEESSPDELVKGDEDAECEEGKKPDNDLNEDGSSAKVVDEEKSLEEKLAEMQDKYIRLSAEFDNYRKRTLREKIDLSKYAGEDLLVKLLPVFDDFERAVSHMETATDCTAIKAGIDLIYGKFAEFLKQNGVKEIESLDCAFNVDLHDAVAKVPVEEKDRKGRIVDVIQKGYYLHDKIIRHSKVVVGE